MNKLKSLFQIIIYSLAAFGFTMLCAYIIVKLNPESRSFIPMAAITQCLIYVSGIALGIILFISDLIFHKLSEKQRICGFFGLLYIMGMIYFQLNAPIGPFDKISHFFGFSIWILWMSALCLAVWHVYRSSLNRSYNDHLANYQHQLNKKEQ